MKKFVILISWIGLTILTVLLKRLLDVPMFIYGVLRAAKNKELASYLKQIAIVLDVGSNVIGQYALNRAFRLNNWYAFGNRKDTISYAMAKNKQSNNLSKFGLWVEKIINLFEKDHLNKAIKNNEEYERIRKCL